MSQYFCTKNGFYFPDEIFPEIPAKVALESPDKAARRIEVAQDQVASLKPEAQLDWAREALLHAEIYGSIPKQSIERAKSVILEQGSHSAHACYLIGNWYLFGLFGFPLDHRKAKEYYRASIKLQGARAWYRMGASAEDKGDIDLCVSRYEAGAKLGDSACLYRLAVAVLKGQFGLAPEQARAISYLQKACDNADEDFPQPLFLLGMIYLGEVQNVSKVDREKGLSYIEKAATLHFSPAQMRMAAAYQNSEREFNWFTILRYLHCVARQERFLAFNQARTQFGGDPEVQLTKIFLCGFKPKIAPNEEWAYKFASAGYEQKNATAQFALGYFNEVGLYIPRNMEQAIKYYVQSTNNNCEAAKQRLAKFKEGATGETDLSRSATITRKDHERVIARANSTISETGKELSDKNLIAELGQSLEKSGAKDESKVELLDQRVKADAKVPYPLSPAQRSSKSPYPITPIQLKDPAPAKTDIKGESLSYPEPLGQPISTVNNEKTKKAALEASFEPQIIKPVDSTPLQVPVTQAKAPYPSSGLSPRKEEPPRLVPEKKPTTPYPASPSRIVEPESPSSSPPKQQIKKAPYAVSPEPIKTAMYIPSDSSAEPSPQNSPLRMQRTPSPVRSFSSAPKSPGRSKGHARSQSTVPSRSPSPFKSPKAFFAKIKSNFTGEGPEYPSARPMDISFDQPDLRPNEPQPVAQPIVPPAPQTNSYPFNRRSQTFEAPTTAAPMAPYPDAPMRKTQTMEGFQSPSLRPSGGVPPISAAPTVPAVPVVPRSGNSTPVSIRRKPVGQPSSNYPIYPTSSAGSKPGSQPGTRPSSRSPSPERPISSALNPPLGNKIVKPEQRAASPLRNMSMPLQSAQKPVNVHARRQSAQVVMDRKGAQQGQSTTPQTIKPATLHEETLPLGDRNSIVASQSEQNTPDRPRPISSVATAPGKRPFRVNPNALSFDQMGIQTVTEDKEGPCVIA